MANAKRQPDIPDANAKKIEEVKLSPPVAAEREWRRYVKRAGGLRKDLDLTKQSVEEPSQTIGQRIEFLSGVKKRKPEEGWDESIIVPGFENVIGSMPAAKPQALLESQVIAQQKTIDELQKTVAELTKKKGKKKEE